LYIYAVQLVYNIIHKLLYSPIMPQQLW